MSVGVVACCWAVGLQAAEVSATWAVAVLQRRGYRSPGRTCAFLPLRKEVAFEQATLRGCRHIL